MRKSSPDSVLILVDRDKCGICGCCVPVCPPDALVLHDAFLAVDHDTCTECMKCLPVCPTNALYMVPVAEAMVQQGGL